ncbi:MAG: helix-turn-helix transcriptional regulator [Actinobacteria bacterium]|nr:helix-turn-helix transcriptional regulator [Actinomycetota bacterium]
MMPETKQRTIELTDPRALRAVAHPIRLELIGLLRRSGPMTATQAATRIGESPASCSFHLRQLAKYGLVEEAGGGRGRERPWRATAPLTSWSETSEDEDRAEATAMLARVVIERYFGQALGWLERRRSEPAEWAGIPAFGDRVLYLTPAELEQLEERIDDLLDPFLERLEDPSARPDAARPVNLIQLLFPLPREPEAD